MRKVLGVIIAPFIPAALLALLPLIFSSFWPFNQTIYLLIISISVVVGYIAFFIIGLPLIYWVKTINRLTLPNLILNGSVSGLIIIYIIGTFLGSTQDSIPSIGFSDSLWGIILGAIVSLTYGLISGITHMSRKRRGTGLTFHISTND